jgi:hypothetical protein
MFRELGSKIVKFCKDEYAIKKDAHNFIFWGGLALSVCVNTTYPILKQVPKTIERACPVSLVGRVNNGSTTNSICPIIRPIGILFR